MQAYSRFDRILRQFVPSIAKMSYNPVFKAGVDIFSSLFGMPFQELRDLPPNHLRIRIGVANNIFSNHVYFLQMGYGVWLNFLAGGYCSFDSAVVELGCGCGRLARPLKDDWFKGTYLGVDIDEEMLEYCRRHFPANQFQFVLSPHKSKTYSSGNYGAGERKNLGLSISEPNSKDFVFSSSLYSHLLEEEFIEYMRETYRILRPGGCMYMSFFCLEDVELGGRWTFSHKQDNAFIENTDLPEAAVAYHKSFVVDLAQSLGFHEVSVIPHAVQSVLLARK